MTLHKNVKARVYSHILFRHCPCCFLRCICVIYAYNLPRLRTTNVNKSHHHHHRHVVPPARISFTLSRHFSLSLIASGGLQGYILCPYIVAICKFQQVVLLLHGHMWGSIGVHQLMSSSLLHQQCPAVSGSSNLYSFRNGGQVSV